MTKVTIEAFLDIRKDSHEVFQKPGTYMFVVEVPEGGKQERILYKQLEALGYKFNEERCVFEYFGK